MATRMAGRSWRVFLDAVLFLLLFFRFVTSSDEPRCPHGCTCTPSVVNCRHSNLTSLPSNLPSPGSIRTLLLSGNRITRIGLELQDYPALTRLDVASNNVSYITDGAFNGLSNMVNLVLRRNYLMKFTNETFQGLSNLHTLDLGYNMLKTLTNGSFTGLQNLEQLDLMKNNMSSISSDAFSGLESLKVLNLTSNLFKVFPKLGLSKLISLTRLVLDDNKIKTISTFSFSNLHQLKFLSLSGNHISQMEPFAFAMSESAPASPLTELNLKGMDLPEVPIQAFSRLTNLEVLDISKNMFKTLKRGSFSELTNLRKLTIMSSKYLTAIENGTFQFMYKLEEMYIQHNKELMVIEQTAFPSAPTLVILILSSNSVRTFHPQMVDWVRNVSVDLRDNRIHCDCQIAWMLSTLKNATSALTRKCASNLTCASPHSLAGKPILNLVGEVLKCETSKTSTHTVLKRVQIAAITAGVTCLVLIVVTVVVKFRKRICMTVRRQYRYHSYKNNGGVFTVNGKREHREEGTPMKVIRSYKDYPDVEDHEQD